MKNNLLLLLLPLILLSSCDTFFHANGTVVDSETMEPIPHARIQVKGKDYFYTDSLGQYKIDRSFLGMSIKVDMMVEKSGYMPLYIDCSNKSFRHQNAVLRMVAVQKPFVPAIQQVWVRRMYWFDLVVVSIFNLFTLLFVLFRKRLLHRFAWVMALLFLNFSFDLLYMNAMPLNFSLLHGPFYLVHYWTHPYTVVIALPVVSLLFWYMFLYRRAKLEQEA